MTVVPPLLKNGDKIGIISPSRMIGRQDLDVARQVFKNWGLEVVLGQAVFNNCGYFAGTDNERLADLQQMLDDPEIRAVFCSRGGYGLTRIIDGLDFAGILASPKWLIGFSDITALHLAFHQKDILSIHGLMPVQFSSKGVEKSLNSLKTLLFDGKFDYRIEANIHNRLGKTTAKIIGGNLSLIVDSLGTPTEIDTQGKVLFLEEIDEYLYKIDRMLTQLGRAGKLHHLAGLIIGDFSQMKDTKIPFGKGIKELIHDHVTGFDYPVAYDVPLGHKPHNLAIPCLAKVTLEVTKNGTRLMMETLS